LFYHQFVLVLLEILLMVLPEVVFVLLLVSSFVVLSVLFASLARARVRWLCVLSVPGTPSG
jgi:hypothetical protein